MSASTTYTALRDDSGYRSLSHNERTFLHSCATGTAPGSNHSVLRTDGRHAGESRPIRLAYGRAHNMSECTVQFGSNTRVSSSVSCHLIPPPHPDRPNDGSITFAVDLSPMSAMGFEYAQPASTVSGGIESAGGMGQAQSEGQKHLTNRILRILERTLLSGGAIDAEALCVQSGKWVWRLHIDVTVLDHGGNLFDACVLSTVAAMRHFRKPEVQITEGDDSADIAPGSANRNMNSSGAGPNVLHSDEREPTPLPLHHTPLTMTFALFSDPTGETATVSALIDPSSREELVMDGNVTFSFNKYGEICSLDFAGGCELKPRQFVMCAKLGKTKCVELCNMLEESLIEADKKSIEERLTRLKVAATSGFASMNVKDLPLPDLPENVPFVERTDYERDDEMMEIDQDDLTDIGSKQAIEAAAIAAAEEESYRIQALDYSLGHVAAKVKENNSVKEHGYANQASMNNSRNNSGPIFGGSLLDAMLKSAAQSSSLRKNQCNNFNSGSAEDSKIKASTHTGAADLEIAQFVERELTESSDTGKTTTSTKKKSKQPILMESDEEEETTMLQSEFLTVSDVVTNVTGNKPHDYEECKPTEKKKKGVNNFSKNRTMDMGENNLDLSMAIKKKNKKKKKAKAKN